MADTIFRFVFEDDSSQQPSRPQPSAAPPPVSAPAAQTQRQPSSGDDGPASGKAGRIASSRKKEADEPTVGGGIRKIADELAAFPVIGNAVRTGLDIFDKFKPLLADMKQTATGNAAKVAQAASSTPPLSTSQRPTGIPLPYGGIIPPSVRVGAFPANPFVAGTGANIAAPPVVGAKTSGIPLPYGGSIPPSVRVGAFPANPFVAGTGANITPPPIIGPAKGTASAAAIAPIAGGAGVTAAGGAATGGAGAATGAAAGLAATLGPIAIAAAATGVALTLCVKAATAFAQAVGKRADELANFNAAGANARARNEIAQVRANLRAGRDFGENFARFDEARGQAGRALQRLTDVFENAILEKLLPVIEGGAATLQLIASLDKEIKALFDFVVSAWKASNPVAAAAWKDIEALAKIASKKATKEAADDALKNGDFMKFWQTVEDLSIDDPDSRGAVVPRRRIGMGDLRRIPVGVDIP